MNDSTTRKLGLPGLVGIVLGTMVGAGIFNMAQTMTVHAGLGAILIAMAAVGSGVLVLALTFRFLSEAHPDLNAGIYQYAQKVGGDYLGFNIAWGYWLSVTVSIIAFAVMLNDSLGALFFPGLLRHSWPTVLFGLGIIWIMCLVMLCGVNRMALVNALVSGLKYLLIVFILIVLLIYAKLGAVSYEFWGNADLGGVGTQTKNDMMVALWSFIGIEGAVMMSGRAKSKRDVGWAGIIGFLLSWFLYTLVLVLCFGVMGQKQLASLPNPSMAYVMRAVCGDWAYYFVITSVIVSLLGCWIAWTLVCTNTPYGAATVKIMPTHFMRVTKRGVPAFSLVASCSFMSAFLLLVCTSQSLYLAAINLTGIMVLPAYFFSGLFSFKTARAKADSLHHPKATMALSLLCIGFTAWMLYAGGLHLILMSTPFYLAGTWFYILARRQHNPGGGQTFSRIMTRRDKFIFALLCAGTVTAAALFATGRLTI